MPNAINIPVISVSPSNLTMIPGMMDDAFIKALNVNMGLTDKPTTLSLGLISSDGTYRDYSADLSYLTPYFINVGALQFVMYLQKAQKQYETEVKSCTLEFTDGSHILDRVFIGLIGTHTLDPPTYTEVQAYASTYVSCDPCYALNELAIPDANAQEIIEVSTPPYSAIYTNRTIKQSTLNSIGDWQQGGFLFMGDQKFPKTQCTIGEFDYSFEQLKTGLANMGITINIPDVSQINGTSYLRRSYTGRLREVLNNWCADFGMIWSYDYTKLEPTVDGIDLRLGTLSSRIKLIATTAKLIASSSKPTLTTSISESSSLEGTFSKFQCTRYKRESAPRDFKKTTYYATGYKNITTTDLIAPAFLDGRSHSQFDISCMLAKYQTDARLLYNWYRAVKSGDPKMLKPLGISISFAVPAVFLAPGGIVNLKREIIDKCTDDETYDKITQIFDPVGAAQDPPQDNYEMYIGLFSEEVAKKYLEWEAGIANDFMGQYFYTNLNDFANEEFGGWNLCFTGANWRATLKSKFSPKPKSFFAMPGPIDMNQQRLPFGKYCYGAMNVNLWTQYNWFTQPYIKIFKRSNSAWPQTQEHIDEVFTKTTAEGVEDLLKPYLPHFQPITGRLKTLLKSRFKGNNLPIQAVLDAADSKKQIPMLVIGPSAARLLQIQRVSEVMTVLNPKELNRLQEGADKPPLPSCDASTLCEIQGNVEKDVCDPKHRCPNYNSPPSAVTIANSIGKIWAARKDQAWPEGLISTHAKAITLTFVARPGGPVNINIIAPAATWPLIGNIYMANYIEDVESFYWSDGIERVLGDLDYAPPGDVSQIDIAMDDQSSNAPLFATADGSILTKIWINDVGFITLEDYHAFIQGFAVMENTSPKEDVTVTFGGADFGPLATYMRPSDGLNSLSLSLGSDGLTSTATWSSNLPTPLKQDLFTSEIEPKIKATLG